MILPQSAIYLTEKASRIIMMLGEMFITPFKKDLSIFVKLLSNMLPTTNVPIIKAIAIKIMPIPSSSKNGTVADKIMINKTLKNKINHNRIST